MAIFIIAPFIIAAIARKRIRPAVSSKWLIPLYIAEAGYIVCQVMTLLGNYAMVPYARYIQIAFLLSLLFPILGYGLYGRAVAGSAMTIAGTLANKLAMAANGGRMPVKPALSKLTGYFSETAFGTADDAVHVLMTDETALKVLCDWIDTGFSVMSPGDVLIHLFTSVVIYGVILKTQK